LKKFWKWDYFGEYMGFLVTFMLLVGGVTMINLWIFRSDWITETLGFLALMVESTLAMPQVYQNYNTKSCQGLRHISRDHFTFIFVERNWYYPGSLVMPSKRYFS
jgi:hypothetical protein